MNEMKILKNISNEIGIELTKINKDRVDITTLNGCYAVDDSENVIALVLKAFFLREVPSGIAELKNLEHLNLTANGINKLPGEIGEITKLKELILIGNNLRELPKEIVKLKNLKNLFLGANRISYFPMEITEIPNFERLGIGNNEITKIPHGISELKNLPKLKELFLKSNKLKALPPEITQIGLEIKWEWDKSREGIYLEGNPIEIPPLEIIKKGIPAIKAYFQSLKKETNLPLNEVKVLLVGDGAAGKTSLVKQMRGQDFNKNESQTHGINIDSWEVNQDETKIKVRLWDFGGQEIMHATHQFFLSKRSLYILVLDGRKDEKTEYWLNHVNSFGGASPVMVVLNKIDEHPGFEVNRRFLQDKYPNIKGFYRVSCASGEGITDFKNALARELAAVELMRTTWAQNWFKVKSRLEQMTENFISYQQYQEICTAENIHDESAQETLVDFLNDLGVILRFKDFQLEDTHVLEPRWITNAVYKIINSPILSAGHGVLETGRLKEILKPTPGEDKSFHYPADKYPYILQLMKKFELCYAIDENRMLVPDLLSAEEPALAFEKTNALAFRFHYNFLPRSIMPRFIVKRHQDIKNELRWRTGVVLEEKRLDAAALVKVDEREKKIFIYVTGSPPRDYFAVLRKTFHDIHDSFEKLEVEEWISLPDHDKIAVEYQELLGYELAGREEIFIGKLGKAYRVQQLLSGIEKPGDRQPLRMNGEIIGKNRFFEEGEIYFPGHAGSRTKRDIPPGKEIYISYAWGGESEEIANRLDEAFKEKGITIIRDRRDLGFKGRIKEFMERIGRGKCVIVVISKKYLESENCMYELIQISKTGRFSERIFPVVLEDAKIYKPIDRIKYVKYWEKEIQDLDEQMKGVSQANLQGFREDIDLYADIRKYLPRLTDILRDMNTLTVEIHSETGFEELVRAAAAKIEE